MAISTSKTVKVAPAELGTALDGMRVKCKILIISYLFPPVGGIGVQRALSLAKYLSQDGYEVHVLKASNGGGPVRDPDLAMQIPTDVMVHTAFSPEVPFLLRQKLWARLTQTNRAPQATNGAQQRFSLGKALASRIKRLFSPEPEIVWVPFALRQARRIIREYGIEVVLVTVPPFSALLVGSRLRREFPGLMLVSDFRDEWLTFYLKDFDFQNSAHSRCKAERIEREAVEASDLVVAVNGSSSEEIRRRYADQPPEKFVVVPNGYDPHVIAGIQRQNRIGRSARMLVTHVGTVYKTASPCYYMDAVDALSEELRSQFETRFVGRLSESERSVLERRKSLVKVFGFMPQAEALNWLDDTDYLLLTMTNEISIPGKIFEYMAARKPILAITPRGSEVDRLLRETRSGRSAPPDDPSAIEQLLVKALEDWREGRASFQGEMDAIRRYERPRLVRLYGELIRQAAACRPVAAPPPGTKRLAVGSQV